MQPSPLLWNPITLETSSKPNASQISLDAIILDRFLFQKMSTNYDSTSSPFQMLAFQNSDDFSALENCIVQRREALKIIKKFLEDCATLVTQQIQDEQTQLQQLSKQFSQLPTPIETIIQELKIQVDPILLPPSSNPQTLLQLSLLSDSTIRSLYHSSQELILSASQSSKKSNAIYVLNQISKTLSLLYTDLINFDINADQFKRKSQTAILQKYDISYCKYVNSLVSYALEVQKFLQPSDWVKSLQRNISQLKSICQLPSVYKECVKETLRRRNFVFEEYQRYISTINRHLTTLQEEENTKRKQFVISNALETDALSSALLQQLFPFLKASVPSLEVSSLMHHFDTQLPTVDESRLRDLSYVVVNPHLQQPLEIQDIDTDSETEETEAEISLDSSIIDSTFDFEVVTSPNKKVDASVFDKHPTLTTSFLSNSNIETSNQASSLEGSSLLKNEQETQMMKSKLIEEQSKHELEVSTFKKKIEELELENENSQKSVEQFLSQYLSASSQLQAIRMEQQSELEKLKQTHAKDMELLQSQLQQNFEEKIAVLQSEKELLMKRVSELIEENNSLAAFIEANISQENHSKEQILESMEQLKSQVLLKPNEIKIALFDFQPEDVVIFIRRLKSDIWEVFNQKSPHYYLDFDSVALLKQRSSYQDINFIRAQIHCVAQKKATNTDNPYKLPQGTVYHIVYIKGFTNPPSSASSSASQVSSSTNEKGEIN